MCGPTDDDDECSVPIAFCSIESDALIIWASCVDCCSWSVGWWRKRTSCVSSRSFTRRRWVRGTKMNDAWLKCAPALTTPTLSTLSSSNKSAAYMSLSANRGSDTFHAVHFVVIQACFLIATPTQEGREVLWWVYRVGQKVCHYGWRLISSAYIFKMPEPVSMIFGTLQHRFILKTFIYSMFLEFIT